MVVFSWNRGAKLVRMAVSLAHLYRTATLILILAAGGPAAAGFQAAPDAARRFARANEYVQAGKPEAAIPIYKELTAAFPAEPSFGVNLTIAQYKAGLYRDALRECDRLLRLQPELFPAWLFRGASYLKLGEASSAIEPLRKALTMRPDDVNARLMLADALLAVRNHAEAAAQYVSAARAMPDNPRPWYGLQLCYRALAEQLHAQLDRTAPASAEFLALTADFETDRGEWARAYRHYRQALALRPSFRGLHGKVAEIYERTGHPAWALAERGHETNPASPPCDDSSAECEFAAGRLESAAGSTQDTPGALYWRAAALRMLSQRAAAKLQDLPPARERFEAAAETEELSARYRDAAAAWKQALALAPGDHELQRRLALALCHSNDCASALPLLHDLLSRSPASVELNYLYGLALNSTQDPGRALPYLETAVRLDAGFLPAHAALGEAYLQAGKPEQAIPHLEAASREDDTGNRHYQLARAYQATAQQARAREALLAYRVILDRRAAEERDEPKITPP